MTTITCENNKVQSLASTALDVAKDVRTLAITELLLNNTDLMKGYKAKTKTGFSLANYIADYEGTQVSFCADSHESETIEVFAEYYDDCLALTITKNSDADKVFSDIVNHLSKAKAAKSKAFYDALPLSEEQKRELSSVLFRMELGMFAPLDCESEEYKLAIKAFVEGGCVFHKPIKPKESPDVCYLENANINPRIKEKRVAKAKKPDAILKAIMTFAGKDDVRWCLNGVNVCEGMIQASNGHYLARLSNVDTSCWSKGIAESPLVIDRAGNPIDMRKNGRYPDIDRVIPETETSIVVDVKPLADRLRGMIAALKIMKIKSSYNAVQIQLGHRDYAFNAEYMLNALEACLRLGHQKACISFDSKRYGAVKVESGDLLIVVMPMVEGSPSIFQKIEL